MAASDGNDRGQVRTTSPQGWYPDHEGRRRWLDGSAWGPLAPPVASTSPPARKRNSGKIVMIVLAVLFVPGILISMGQQLQGESVEPQDAVIDVADGCQRTYDLLLEMSSQRPIPSDAEVMPHLRGLRDAAKANDPLLASDLQNMIDAENATESSNATGVIMRRCIGAGHITEDQVAVMVEAARRVVQ